MWRKLGASAILSFLGPFCTKQHGTNQFLLEQTNMWSWRGLNSRATSNRRITSHTHWPRCTLRRFSFDFDYVFSRSQAERLIVYTFGVIDILYVIVLVDMAQNVSLPYSYPMTYFTHAGSQYMQSGQFFVLLQTYVRTCTYVCAYLHVCIHTYIHLNITCGRCGTVYMCVCVSVGRCMVGAWVSGCIYERSCVHMFVCVYLDRKYVHDLWKTNFAD